MSHQSYLLVKLELEGETDRSAEYTSQNITSALKVLFGETGAAIPFKVIKSCRESNSVIISCPDTYLVKLRAALTLQSSYQGIIRHREPFISNDEYFSGVDCCYSVQRVAKELICLSA